MLTAGRKRGEIVVVAPPEVDLATELLLVSRIERACALKPDRVVVDFSAVTFCDSTAVRVLLDASARIRGGGCELEVRSPGPHLRRVAEVLGLSAALGVPLPD